MSITCSFTQRQTIRILPQQAATKNQQREREYWCGLESVTIVSTCDLLKFGWTRAARGTK
jgi:hypothetical protein